ncbi:MAG: NUDIX hydrolase [Pseudomonadales bacterium]|nr:NUDIX hydrolase [Pseudomonadales bacterium]MEC9240213.1 NUDIX hydrolase [Pseudomonadota bacterium]MEC9251925.1 NUDIX hydrolase [Pseudomonadota bacterium]MEE3133493.1 NUDIX hydrolase [Pseudomonadota bacterium]|tara:strand:- start:22602 stop:23180 length:579 start_codon:yes stop_codon:yes gene_type:complete
MEDQLEWQKLRSESGPDLGILNVRFDWLKHPTEDRTLKRLVLESVDWINVVALTEDGQSVMVEQYRFGVGSCTLETPGGMVDSGETPLQAAQRELKEETGYSGGRWKSLGAVQPNPAIHSHLCHHFLAEGVTKNDSQDLGQGEAIAVHLYTIDQVRSAIVDGSLRHVLAISALSRVFDLWTLPFVEIEQPFD